MVSGETVSMSFVGIGRSHILDYGKPHTAARDNRLEMRSGPLVEWYINHPEDGLEHGITLQERPEGDGPVRAVWKLGGTMSPSVAPLTSATGGLIFKGENGKLKFGGVRAWDASGKSLSVRMELNNFNILEYVLDDTGAEYPVTVDPVFSQVEKLVAPVRNDDDAFGWAVDMEGDYVVVGAPDEDTVDGVDAGAVYVFQRIDRQWTLVQTLYGSVTGDGYCFGNGVDLDGDNLIVGAPGGSGAVAGAGMAFVFTLVGGVWVEQDNFFADDGALDDGFGWSVTIDGDRAVVGSVDAEIAGNEAAGAAYVFTRTAGTWTQQFKLFAHDGDEFEYFGNAVSLSGDTVAVGAVEANEMFGGVYVYQAVGPLWVFQDMFNSSTAGLFGQSVSLSGDTLAAGATWDMEFGLMTGAAYVYVRNNGVWSFQQKMTPPANEWLSGMGTSISVDGDNLLVGADVSENPYGFFSGRAFLYHREGGVWKYAETLISADGQDDDYFGTSAALSGHELIIGAYGKDNFKGAAYIFNASAPTVLSFTPGNNTAGIAGNTLVSAVFDQALNASSVSTATFTLVRDTDRQSVNGTVAWDRDKNTAVFTPQNDLFPSTGYTASLSSSISNIVGLSKKSETGWSFTTSSSLDLQNAGILSVYPEARSANMSVKTCVVVTFGEDMDPTSINSGSFQLKGVNGSVRYDASARKAYFIPSKELQFLTTYEAVMTTGVTDLSGNPLSAEQAWIFTTEVESSDSDGDGISDNQDGYPLDPTKATFRSAVSDMVVTISLEAESGAVFRNIRSLCPLDPAFDTTNYPEGVNFGVGMVNFEVINLTPGASIRVCITCPAEHPGETTVYKAGKQGFYPFTAYADLTATSCTISLTDGELGDEDLARNGRISDPVGVGDVIGSSSLTGSSSAGCMMNPTADFGLEWLLIFAVPGLFRFRRGRGRY